MQMTVIMSVEAYHWVFGGQHKKLQGTLGQVWGDKKKYIVYN